MHFVWVLHTSNGQLEGVFDDSDDAKTVAAAIAGWDDREELPWKLRQTGWSATVAGVTYFVSCRVLERGPNLNDRTLPAKGNSDD